MEWSPEAEESIKKVPFFVRKRVRKRVEDEARQAGKTRISTADVRLTQKRYLSKMAEEVKGYALETCFGPGGCPNRAIESDRLLEQLEERLKAADIRNFLEERVKGGLKHHHEFRVTLADCPNACSQPQIRDLGIIGACEPTIGEVPCTLCGECVEVCKEDAIFLEGGEETPVVDYDRCLKCGQCITVCPTGTLVAAKSGYRVLLGGKLGRHPRLAQELPGCYSEDQVLDILDKCIAFYKAHSKHGERFSELYEGPESLGLDTDV
ncbi:MAG: 4Fe-4S binding protein [Deltaproteobacteria bacterium]|nr:4Fe-4S binding protein [Deltaproteobacteria bacterium]